MSRAPGDGDAGSSPTVAGASATTHTRTLYFNAAGGAEGLYRSGVLQPDAKGALGGAWISDPSDLRNVDPKPAPPGDDLHGDGLVFHTAPFAEDTEIDGRIALDLALAIDGPDADVGYNLYLITPDGKAHELGRPGGIRARYRESPFEHAELVKPGRGEQAIASTTASGSRPARPGAHACG